MTAVKIMSLRTHNTLYVLHKNTCTHAYRHAYTHKHKHTHTHTHTYASTQSINPSLDGQYLLYSPYNNTTASHSTIIAFTQASLAIHMCTIYTSQIVTPL